MIPVEGTTSTTSNAARLAQAVSEVADLIQANSHLSVWRIAAFETGEIITVSVHAPPGDVEALADAVGADAHHLLGGSDLIKYSTRTPGYDVEVWGDPNADGVGS